jgi:hypothetical protein
MQDLTKRVSYNSNWRWILNLLKFLGSVVKNVFVAEVFGYIFNHINGINE